MMEQIRFTPGIISTNWIGTWQPNNTITNAPVFDFSQMLTCSGGSYTPEQIEQMEIDRLIENLNDDIKNAKKSIKRLKKAIKKQRNTKQ